ncbi:MAG TPA: CBS and ACT domain-containing protein [Anaerolineales bacterium]|nr:CBS and ACT domain-containing protein [Anaerolineales bacterium]
MLVGERMSKPVITVRPETSMPEALDLMRKEHIRRLPVVNKKGELVGIVTEADLLKASPSEATSLSIYEVTYLLSKLTVDRIMTKKVVTITEDTPLEEAARIMADHKFSGLPVVRGKAVVGMITETSLFRIFLELLGARRAGIRLTVSVPDTPGKLADLTRAIHDLGGNIIALGTFMGESPSKGLVTIKVEGVKMDELKKAIRPLVDKIIDIRSTAAV